MILTEMPESSRIFARKKAILPPPTSMAVLIGILGTPTWSKKSFCSFGGMMTVTSSPVCRIKSPFGM